MTHCPKRNHPTRYDAQRAAEHLIRARGWNLASMHRCDEHDGWHLSRQRARGRSGYAIPLMPRERRLT